MQKMQAWISPLLLQEYRETPQELFSQGKINRAQYQALLTGLASFVACAQLVRPRQHISICRDPEDNMVLECCRAAQAHFLITGDKDLLELESRQSESVRLKRLYILTPRAFLERWEE
jgi:putative PIN family toxin of toxin-antitoxin system